MAINLKKGGTFNLTKEEPTLTKVMIGLGWEMTSQTLDLDASVFMLGANRKLISEDYFIFYNNLKSPDGAIQHTGDNRSGKGDDDDEMILANLAAVNPEVTEILVTVTIHEAAKRGHNFGLLKDAYIRLYDVETKREILRYDLDAENASNSEVEFGKIYKTGNEWKFTALGNGSNKGLQGFIDIYA
jgi:tellurium resistance protein TerD